MPHRTPKSDDGDEEDEDEIVRSKTDWKLKK